MAKAQKRAPARKPPATRGGGEDTFELTIKPSEEGKQSGELTRQAQTIVINDKDSHERGLELLGGWKALRRAALLHWKGIKQPVDQLKKNLLEQERRDIAPMDVAIDTLEGKCLSYADRAKQAAEDKARADREAAEARAAADRSRELQAAEDRALKLEAESEALSARELWFVTKYVELLEPAAIIDAGVRKVLAGVCKQAGYKDPETQVERLLNSEKILNAIGAKRQAIEIRQQAAARQQAPLDVDEALEAKPDVGYVAGMVTKTYVSSEIVDAAKVVAAMVERGELGGLEPVQKYLNDKAKSLPRAQFEAAYPGARWLSRKGIAG